MMNTPDPNVTSLKIVGILWNFVWICSVSDAEHLIYKKMKLKIVPRCGILVNALIICGIIYGNLLGVGLSRLF